jgi:hypothetical protein
MHVSNTLKKHVQLVTYIEDVSEDPSPGYFVVTFDSNGHGGGTFVYPATKEQVKQYKAGNLKDEEFYGW